MRVHRSIPSMLSCFFLVLCQIGRAQTLEVGPGRVLADEAAVIRASGLEANEQVTIRADLVDGAGEAWASSADFVADAQGAVDSSTQAPISGSYKQISSMGLIWSMLPREKSAGVYRPPKDLGTQTIQFRLMRKGQQAATAQLEQLFLAEDLRQVTIKGALHGVLFEPSGAGPYPGVLVLGGSEGGVPRQRAAWLAAHGFAALALAYFRYEELPPELQAIPLEYFGSALGWMMKRPEIAAEHIAVMGASRGGELALQLGSMYPQIKAVVAYVPANTLHPACCRESGAHYAWTWHGSPLAYMTPGRRTDPAMEQQAAIHVENTRGPVLMISGLDDGIWNSSTMADAVLLRLNLAHFPYHFENLKYNHAGHWAGHPSISPAWHGKIKHPVSGKEIDPGGTTEGNALSSLDAIPKVLNFLRENLGAAPAEKPAGDTQHLR